MPKRTGYLSWDEYFMGIALLSAKRSKDPGTQVGACIVSENNRIMSVGYNGFPKGCDDDDYPWDRTAAAELDTKYPYVCHAELNAILNNRGADLEGCRIYVPLFPCNECSKAIIQSGIKEVVFLSDKYDGTPSVIASKRMLVSAGVTIRKLECSLEALTLSYRESDV
ncbi:MAG: dCMP deaminase family protein [Clostridia bacterium]|nr:dCMP deaminase family protein [Clostridia bacterium]